MAKKKRNQLPANLADFSGPDADRENIEKLAAAAQEANAKAGHNGGEPLDEVIKRNADAIEVALVEIDSAGRIMQKARAGLAAARKTAKTDMGSKAWVDSVEAAVKLKRQADKGGMSGIVSEHRQMGRVLRVIDCKLGTQFNLFAVPEETAAGAAMDAELQGQHAQANNEPISNNPFTPGTADFVDWEQGWNNAMAAQVRKMGPGNGEAAAH